MDPWRSGKWLGQQALQMRFADGDGFWRMVLGSGTGFVRRSSVMKTEPRPLGVESGVWEAILGEQGSGLEAAEVEHVGF